MSITDDLRELAALHSEGHLTDQEFSAAKRRLLGDDRPGPPAEAGREEALADPAPRTAGKAYRSSRWSSGNHVFPDALTLTGDGMTFRKRTLFGSSEEQISFRAVASVRTKNGVLLSDVCIETSGGSQPIVLHGLWKSDAREIQEAIRAFLGKAGAAEPPPAGTNTGGRT